MKKSIFLFISLMLTTMGIVSCIGNNDNPQQDLLTPEEQKMAFNLVAGTYDGQMVYASVNPNDPKDTRDTVDVRWTISSDSTMRIENFPLKALSYVISNETFKEALNSTGTLPMNCGVYFYKLSPVAFLINPVISKFDLNYGGATHSVQIAFYHNNANSYAYVNETNKKLQMQVWAGAIFEDGKQTKYLSQNMPFVFIADKK